MRELEKRLPRVDELSGQLLPLAANTGVDDITNIVAARTAITFFFNKITP